MERNLQIIFAGSFTVCLSENMNPFLLIIASSEMEEILKKSNIFSFVNEIA
jgi:hypothetical protein